MVIFSEPIETMLVFVESIDVMAVFKYLLFDVKEFVLLLINVKADAENEATTKLVDMSIVGISALSFIRVIVAQYDKLLK